jgi:glycosyltransferase involved in cell wall biosynthesis
MSLEKMLSLIVPVYNTPLNLLEKCIKSILCFKDDFFEVIIVDDGSNKIVATFCDQFQKNDHRISVLHQVNQGVSVARNKGLELATGKYIVFVDPDDYVTEELFDYKYFLESDYDLIAFGYIRQHLILKTEIKLLTNFANLQIEFFKNILFLGSQLGDYFGGAIWAKAFKRQFLIDNRIRFDRRLRKAQDRIFMLDVISLTKNIGLSSKTTYVYYENLESICNIYKPNCEERSLAFYDAVCEFLQSNELEGVNAQMVKAKVAYLMFFEVLYLDYFNIDNHTPYTEKLRAARMLFKKMALESFSKDISMNTFIGISEKVKYLLIKNKFWKVLMFFIARAQNKKINYSNG